LENFAPSYFAAQKNLHPSGVYLVRARFDSAQRPDSGQAAAKRVVYLK